jgi:hypothetical protein
VSSHAKISKQVQTSDGEVFQLVQTDEVAERSIPLFGMTLDLTLFAVPAHGENGAQFYDFDLDKNA